MSTTIRTRLDENQDPDESAGVARNARQVRPAAASADGSGSMLPWGASSSG
jgi:hypothetical protein